MTVQLVHCRGMVGAIETIMASQAQTSVGAFIGFCVRRCAGSAPGAEGSMDAGLGLGPGYLLRPSGGDMDVEGSDGEAAFYEAAESLASFSGTAHLQPFCSSVTSIPLLLSTSSAGRVHMLSACPYTTLRQ